MILILGFLFTVIIYAAINAVAGFIGVLLDPWSLLLILVSLIFFMVVTKSGAIIGKYISASFKKKYPYTLAELEGLAAALKNTIKVILGVGVFGFITFAVVSLGHIGAPERLGPSIATILTSLTYSAALSFFVFSPLQVWAENKINALRVGK